MSYADTNLISLAYKAEVSYGTSPGGTAQLLRITGETLKAATQTTQSREMIADRTRGAPILVAVDPSGTVSGELSSGTYDDMLSGAMMAAWPGSAVTTGAVTTISFATSGSTITRSSGSFVTNGFIVGQVVKVAGSASNDGYYPVTDVTATVLTVQGAALVDEAAGASVTISGTPLVHGTTKNSFTFERNYTDLTNEYMHYLGMMVAQAQGQTSTGQIVGFSADLIGTSEVPSGTSTFSGSTAVTTTDPFNALDNVPVIWEGGAVSSAVTNVQWSIRNNLAGKKAIGTRGNLAVRLGGMDVSGQFAMHFQGRTQYQKATNYTTSSLGWVYEDAAGNWLAFNIPSLKYGEADASGQGPDGDVIAQMPYTAFKDANSGYQLIITRGS